MSYKRITSAIFAALIVTVAGQSLVASPKVSAEPLQQNDIVNQLITFCKTKVISKAEAACNQTNMTHARNIAEQHCDINQNTINDGSASDCILHNARVYVADASSPPPSSASAYTTALNKVLQNRGGDPNKEVAAAGGSVSPTSITSKPDDAIKGCDSNNKSCDFTGRYINPAINLLTVVFGIIAVISLILGGIQYSASAGDPQKVTKAKDRIFSTIIAILAYLFLYGFLQFLIPGGLFK
jgi:hypothetical protein